MHRLIQKVQNLKPFLVGVFMGLADLVPGVSGGTIAFLGGIYEKLIQSISNIRLIFVEAWKEGVSLQRIRHSRKNINGNFLCFVFGGILISAIVGSRLIESLLETYPLYVAMFFVGLIIASSVVLYLNHDFHKKERITVAKKWLFLLIGVLVGLILTVGNFGTIGSGDGGFFLAGMIGSIAMILPGISGSYILIIVGMYEHVIAHISGLSSAITSGSMDLLFQVGPNLILFGLGVIVGILTMSNILKRLLKKRHDPTILVLIGCMVGALPAIFPGWNALQLFPVGSILSALGGIAIISVLLYPTLR